MLGMSTAEKATPTRARGYVGGERTGSDAAATSSPSSALSVVPSSDGARSQDQRRAIGTLWLLASIVIDAAIIWVVLDVQFQLVTRQAKLFGIVYVIGSVALLLPTHRQGRIIRRPAESLVKVASRLALTPLLTAALTLTSQR